jgi:hypothetical protein
MVGSAIWKVKGDWDWRLMPILDVWIKLALSRRKARAVAA